MGTIEPRIEKTERKVSIKYFKDEHSLFGTFLELSIRSCKILMAGVNWQMPVKFAFVDALLFMKPVTDMYNLFECLDFNWPKLTGRSSRPTLQPS